ncbi:Hypothetical predicted protein, partial [Paramuricea clavata]
MASRHMESSESTCMIPQNMSSPTVENTSASLRSYRSHLSRVINSSNKAITDYIDSQDPTSLVERKEDIRKYFRKIESLTLIIQDLDPLNASKYDADLTKDGERSDEVIHALSKAAKTVTMPTADSRRHPGTFSRRINESLKPAILSKDASPTEMRHWIDAFKSYYSSNDMDSFSVQERQSYFKILLDVDLRTRIMAKMSDDTDVFGNDGCIDLLEKDFLARYPLFSRRLDFFQSQQRPGQAFTDFLAKLKEMSKLADLEKLSVEEIFVFCALRGTTDSDLLDDLLELQDKTLKDIENAASLYESKLVSRSKLNAANNGNDKVMRISAPNQRRYNAKPKPKHDVKPDSSKSTFKRPTTVRGMKEQGLCTRCGRN